MKHRTAYALAMILAAPATGSASAQDTPATPPDGGVERGLNLLQEGTRLLLDSLIDQIKPSLEALEGHIVDLNAYQAPEILPNGDIILRRKTPLPEPDMPPEGATDL